MIKRFCTIISLILLITNAGAQSLSNSLRRQINRAAILAIDDYENCISLSNEDKVYDFPYLFESQESLVFCDLIGSPDYGKLIPVSLYVKDAELLSSVTTTTIRSVQRDEPEFISGKWHITIRLEKSVGIIDKLGEQFTTNELFEGEGFALTFDLVFNKEEKTCQIVRISGKIPHRTKLPEGPLWLVENHSGKDQSLLANGRSVVFHDGERHIMSPARMSLRDDDAVIRCDTLANGLNYKKLSFDIKHKRLRFRPIASSTIGGAYKISTQTHFTSVSSKALEAGVELGVILVPGKKTKFGIYTGAAYSMSDIELGYDDISYSTFTPGWIYSEYVIQNYDMNASQSMSFKDIAIPAFFSMENKLGNWGYLTTDIGVKYYQHLGVDNQFVLNGKFEESGKIRQNTKDMNISQDKAIERNTDLSLLFRMGLDITLVKKVLYGFVKAGYEYGLSPVYTSQESVWYRPSLINDGVYPVSYIPETQKFKLKQTFDDSISFSRQAIWASAGIMIKF